MYDSFTLLVNYDIMSLKLCHVIVDKLSNTSLMNVFNFLLYDQFDFFVLCDSSEYVNFYWIARAQISALLPSAHFY